MAVRIAEREAILASREGDSGSLLKWNSPMANSSESVRSTPQLSANGHRPGCPRHGEIPTADKNGGYMDLFCDCHAFKEPIQLENPTNIAWPAGWTPEMARSWRVLHYLLRPGEPAGGE